MNHGSSKNLPEMVGVQRQLTTFSEGVSTRGYAFGDPSGRWVGRHSLSFNIMSRVKDGQSISKYWTHLATKKKLAAQKTKRYKTYYFDA